MNGLSFETALIQKHQSGAVLLDANLLLLYQIGRFRVTAIGNFAHTKQYTVDDYVLLTKIVRLFRSVVTTPNILTEVSNLAGKLNPGDHKVFREGFKGTIDVLAEQYGESKSAADSPAFQKFGLTDAGNASLCGQNVLVLTDDLPLQQWLASKGFDALNVNHIRRSAWSEQL